MDSSSGSRERYRLSQKVVRSRWILRVDTAQVKCRAIINLKTTYPLYVSVYEENRVDESKGAIVDDVVVGCKGTSSYQIAIPPLHVSSLATTNLLPLDDSLVGTVNVTVDEHPTTRNIAPTTPVYGP